MNDPYRAPTIEPTVAGPPSGGATLVLAAISALVLTPTIFVAVGWLQGSRGFPGFLFAPKIFIGLVLISFLAAFSAFPSRRWQRWLPIFVAPVVGFLLFVVFIEIGSRLTS